MSRRWQILLGASVLLNVFLLGGIAAHVLLRPPHPPGEFRLSWGSSFMSGPARALFEQTWSQRRPEIRARFEEVRTARRAVADVFAQDSLDRARLDIAFAELREKMDEAQRTLHQAMVEVAARLPAEDRRRLIEGALRAERERRGPPERAGQERRSAP